MDKNMMEVMPYLDFFDKGIIQKAFYHCHCKSLECLLLTSREEVQTVLYKFHSQLPTHSESDLIYKLKKFDGFETLKAFHSVEEVRDHKEMERMARWEKRRNRS